MIVTSNLIQITSPSQDPFSVFIRSTIIQQTKMAYQKMYDISILPLTFAIAYLVSYNCI